MVTHVCLSGIVVGGFLLGAGGWGGLGKGRAESRSGRKQGRKRRQEVSAPLVNAESGEQS